MKMSSIGLLKLSSREGRKTEAYKDTKGIWTIGVGHTGPEVHRGLVISDAEVDRLLAGDVKWAEDTVNAVGVPFKQNQFDALVSFVFNVGASAFNNSTMRKFLVKQDYGSAAQEFDKWHIPPEIIGRRNDEKLQFMS
jgi:lysozyme